MMKIRNLLWSLNILAMSLAFAPPHVAQAAKKRASRLSHVFTDIYRQNAWESAESRSGPGSTIRYTQTIRADLERLIADMDIHSVLDVACGDFRWMSMVDLQGATYIGMDVVPELIAELDDKYATDDGQYSFELGDMLEVDLPKADLIIARDVLGHLSTENVHRALKNFRKSGAKWLLTTSFGTHRANFDILNGQWRPINLAGEPFNLGPAAMSFPELGQRAGDGYDDKALVLWDMSALDHYAEAPVPEPPAPSKAPSSTSIASHKRFWWW